MKYPQIGDTVRVKGELTLLKVTGVGKWGAISLEDGSTRQINRLVTPQQKYVPTYAIQVDYGSGWEDVTEEETRQGKRDSLKDYRLNTPYPVRSVTRREPNDLYKE